MKVLIEEVSHDRDEEIIIRCHEVNDEIIQLLTKLKSESTMLLGYDQDHIYRLEFVDVYYFKGTRELEVAERLIVQLAMLEYRKKGYLSIGL